MEFLPPPAPSRTQAVTLQHQQWYIQDLVTQRCTDCDSCNPFSHAHFCCMHSTPALIDLFVECLHICLHGVAVVIMFTVVSHHITLICLVLRLFWILFSIEQHHSFSISDPFVCMLARSWHWHCYYCDLPFISWNDTQFAQTNNHYNLWTASNLYHFILEYLYFCSLNMIYSSMATTTMALVTMMMMIDGHLIHFFTDYDLICLSDWRLNPIEFNLFVSTNPIVFVDSMICLFSIYR